MFEELALKFLHVTEPDEPPNEYQCAVLGFAGWLDNKHPELDAPDSEGWWWYLFEDQHPCCWYVHKKKDEDIFYIEIRGYNRIVVNNLAGKWQRAIVPK